MPLSGGDRKAQAKARREARGIAQVFWDKQVRARAEAEELLRHADQHFCDAWSSLVFWGEPTRNSPTIAQAINGGRPILWAKCRRCGKEPVIDLRAVKRRPETHVHLLDPLDPGSRKMACLRKRAGRELERNEEFFAEHLPRMQRRQFLGHVFVLLMIIDDLYPLRTVVRPNETDPKLIVDPDGVLALPIAFQSFQPVGWRRSEIVQDGSGESQAKDGMRPIVAADSTTPTRLKSQKRTFYLLIY